MFRAGYKLLKEAFAKARRVMQKLPLEFVRFVHFYAFIIKMDETTKPIKKVYSLFKLAQNIAKKGNSSIFLRSLKNSALPAPSITLWSALMVIFIIGLTTTACP